MASVNINVEMLQKGLASFYEFEPNALVFKKQWKAAATESGGGVGPTTKIKVFTGIVAQGVLSEAAPFEVRANDLIESVEELQQAAQQNLAPYIVALPGRIVYELKIVSGVTTKDGYRAYGTVQRVVVGHLKSGQPKYKNVTNKFATLTLYFLNSRGLRQKLDTINLGPTDSVKLQPNQAILTTVEKDLKVQIATTKITDIAEIKPPAPLIIPPPIIAGPMVPSSAIPPQTTTPTRQSSATTLSAFYAETGNTLPSVATRALLYQKLDLGPAGFYVGSAEQNARLLAALKDTATAQAAPPLSPISIAPPTPMLTPLPILPDQPGIERDPVTGDVMIDGIRRSVGQTLSQANATAIRTEIISKGGRFAVGSTAKAYVWGNTTTIINPGNGGYATYDNNERADIGIGGVSNITEIINFFNTRTSYPMEIINAKPPFGET